MSGSVSRPERFALTGTSWHFDPRIHAARKDIADIALAGRLFAPHYARPMLLRCTAEISPLLDRPGGTQISELLDGELFAALDIGGGLAWGYCLHDHYVGYMSMDALAVPRDGEVAGAIRAPQAADPAAVAEGLRGTRYLMGGRSAAGIDCSGLVQAALAPFGIQSPRDSDLQREALGRALPAGATLARNDLVFFPGHVGMMVDPRHLIHASGEAGAVVIEKLAGVAARFDGEMLAKRVAL